MGILVGLGKAGFILLGPMLEMGSLMHMFTGMKRSISMNVYLGAL